MAGALVSQILDTQPHPALTSWQGSSREQSRPLGASLNMVHSPFLCSTAHSSQPITTALVLNQLPPRYQSPGIFTDSISLRMQVLLH